MNKKDYIKAVLHKIPFDKKTKARIEADLATDIDARLDAGETMEDIIACMGTPECVAKNLADNMPTSTITRKNPLRWVFLALASVLMLCIPLAHLYSKMVLAQQLASPNANIGIIGSADGPTAIFVAETYAPRILITALVGLALALFGIFLLMQWRGTSSRTRFIVLGCVLVGYALFLLVGGLSNAPFTLGSGIGGIILSRLINPAFVAPLAVGIASFIKAKKLGKASPAA